MSSREIIKAVAKHHGTTADMIRCGWRSKALVVARHDAMWLLRLRAHLSYPEVARAVGLMNHTSAMHGVGKAQARNDAEPGRGLALLALVTS